MATRTSRDTLPKSLLNQHPLFFSCHLVVEGNQICQVWFAAGKSVLADPKHPSVLQVAGTCFKEDTLHNLPRTGMSGLSLPKLFFLAVLEDVYDVCFFHVIRSLPCHHDLSKMTEIRFLMTSASTLECTCLAPYTWYRRKWSLTWSSSTTNSILLPLTLP